MGVDQDLSGDMVKVVQYSIVSVATGIVDDARMICQPRAIAFADDMTAADFTAWVLSKQRPQIGAWVQEICEELTEDEDSDLIRRILENPKWHRVAFQVISRFSPADIDWEIAQVKTSGRQAHELGKIARILKDRLPPPNPSDGTSSSSPSTNDKS